MTDVRRLHDPASLARAAELYTEVFGAPMNHRLLMGIAANGGQVVGAYDDDELVGYGVSFLARDGERLYQYSQTVAVVPSGQGKGVGRAIKAAQRDAALAEGVELIRWSFDPLHARNAHFNTDVLGGRINTLHEDFYGEGTDRFVVDWELRNTPARTEWDVPSLSPGQAKDIAEGTAIAIPADQPDDELRAPLRALFADALARGLVGVSCRRVDEHAAVYLFAPR